MIKLGKFKTAILLCLLQLMAGCGSGDQASVDNRSNDKTSERKQSNISLEQPSASLTNATPTDPALLPFVKQLRLAIPSYGGFSYGICTATFITPHLLLTAAHCLFDLQTMTPLSPSEISIEMEPFRLVSAEEVLPHPEFTGQFIPSAVFAETTIAPADIGLLVSSEPYFGPLPSLSFNPPLPGESLILAGYGLNGGTAAFSGGLLRVGYATIDAVSAVERVLYWIQDRSDESATCHGDSGGPAFTVDSTNELVIVGITSSGDPRCRPYFVSVNSLTASYLDWINTVAPEGLLIRE